MKKILRQTITNKNKFLISLLLLSLTLLLCLTTVSAAPGDTIYVNGSSGNDSWDGQSAIYDNNSGSGPKLSIKNATGTVNTNGTIHIANGQYTGENNTNITINKNMTIIGQSQTGTIINGTGNHWIFKINPLINVTIVNLTLTNTTTTVTGGGAIFNTGNLTVTNCNFNSNTANAGGAINNGGAIASLSGCNFTNNTAWWSGGAIYNWGTITNLSNCNFTNNNANYGEGGAIYNWAGTITSLSGCNFTSNTALFVGGGAISNTNIINLSGCDFTNNKAANGGAILNNIGTHSTITVHFSRFVNNTATMSNAILCYSGFVDAEYNWWGSNTNPQNITNLIWGNIDADPWLVLSISANPTEILNTKTSNVTANLYTDSNGADHSSESAKYPSEIPLTFNTTWGSITQTILSYGAGKTIFTANGGSVPHQNPITVSVADALNQTATVSTYITIKPVSDLYIQTKTNNQNPTIGDTFTLTYKLGNNGPDAAENVKITFQIPEGLEFTNIKVDTGKYTYDPLTRTVTWTLDSVPVGDPYLYLTVKAAGNGTYKITPNITSDTYNSNTGDDGIISINIQANNNNSSNGTGTNTVKAATKTTIGLQKTGLPFNYLILAILMIVGCLVPRRK